MGAAQPPLDPQRTDCMGAATNEIQRRDSVHGFSPSLRHALAAYLRRPTFADWIKQLPQVKAEELFEIHRNLPGEPHEVDKKQRAP